MCGRIDEWAAGTDRIFSKYWPDAEPMEQNATVTFFFRWFSGQINHRMGGNGDNRLLIHFRVRHSSGGHTRNKIPRLEQLEQRARPFFFGFNWALERVSASWKERKCLCPENRSSRSVGMCAWLEQTFFFSVCRSMNVWTNETAPRSMADMTQCGGSTTFFFFSSFFAWFLHFLPLRTFY